MITVSKNQTDGENATCRLGPVSLRFRSILVATDCTPASEKAVRLGARLAKEFHARFCLVQAISPEHYAVDMRGPFPELELQSLQLARENLQSYVQHFRELRTVKHREIVEFGSPAEIIQSNAESNGIDLLVLGSRGRQGLAKLTLGSVAEWAINRLKYPVLVAGPSCENDLLPIRSIVVATDLSARAARPAQFASSMAQDYNARLTAIHIPPKDGTPKEQTRTEQRINKKLHELMPSGCGDRCSLKFEVGSGDIATAILQSARANRANLVVLGARHKAPLADHMPRTKLSTIIRESRCPVLLVPTGCCS